MVLCDQKEPKIVKNIFNTIVINGENSIHIITDIGCLFFLFFWTTREICVKVRLKLGFMQLMPQETESKNTKDKPVFLKTLSLAWEMGYINRHQGSVFLLSPHTRIDRPVRFLL